MAKVDDAEPLRRLIAKGRLHEVHCAVRSDSSSPAGEFLDLLKDGMWEPDPDAKSLPSDEQIRDHDWFLSAIRKWANDGEPFHNRAVNALDNGVWEFKRGAKRLTFYDTDGVGGYVEKRKIVDYADAECPESDFWQIPMFDVLLRLGHAFPKVGQEATQDDLQISQDVRDEDLRHDEW